jgi:Zn-dependent M28 family amino/carboxypeptidase
MLFRTRMLFWLALAAATAWLLWYMVAVPGESWSGELQPLTAAERELAVSLREHVTVIASREHNVFKLPMLEQAAQYIENALDQAGYLPLAAQRFTVGDAAVRNIEAELKGGARASEIVVVGAHYDSVAGAPGANDNGSGAAALLELARLAHGSRPARTVRFVAFVNEEPPFFKSEAMGSLRYARRSRERGENIVAMVSLETIGYYSDQAGSQRYPFPLGLFYPSTGNFLAFVSDLGSRALMHDAIAAFRRHARFPSEGVAAPAAIPGVDWSDHWAFREAGYPALMVTDTAPYRYPHYHSAADLPDQLDYERLARVVTGMHAVLQTLAGAAGEARVTQ